MPRIKFSWVFDYRNSLNWLKTVLLDLLTAKYVMQGQMFMAWYWYTTHNVN